MEGSHHPFTACYWSPSKFLLGNKPATSSLNDEMCLQSHSWSGRSLSTGFQCNQDQHVILKRRRECIFLNIDTRRLFGVMKRKHLKAFKLKLHLSSPSVEKEFNYSFVFHWLLSILHYKHIIYIFHKMFSGDKVPLFGWARKISKAIF